MKTSLRQFGIAALAAVALTSVATALTITPSTVAVATGNQTSESQIDAAILGSLGGSTELYKQDVGSASDVGTLAGSYETTFANLPLDPAEATITYVGGPIVGPTAFLLVKDGSQIPAWYLYNLTAAPLSWNGTETIYLTGFWPNDGAISHVTLYGGGSVPDGGITIAMLGMGFCVLEFVRRRILV
jgi:hypothetical protein